MKRILVILLCMGFVFSPVFAQNARKKDTKETITFLVKDMDCENCVKKIEKNIAFEKGVTDLRCELSSKTVRVTYNTDKTTEKKLMAAFKKIGYEAESKAESAQPSR